jgi:ParB family chromosome partitioning protein
MEIVNIPLDQIKISSLNTRSDLQAGTEDASLEDLSASIRERGLLSPVTVKPLGDNQFDLIAGQRRYLACRMIGLPEIPAIIREDLDDTQAVIISLIENVHRAEMNPMDKARAFQRIYENVGSYQEVAKQARVSPTTVSRYTALLDLHPSIQEKVSTSEGGAGVGTLSELARRFDPEDQEEVLEEIGGFKQDIQRRMLR